MGRRVVGFVLSAYPVVLLLIVVGGLATIFGGALFGDTECGALLFSGACALALLCGSRLWKLRSGGRA